MNNKPVVIVGGGTAGCMVTSYVANNTDLAVVLVEPGEMSPYDENPRFFDVLADERLVQHINGVAQARALGGGSAINGMLLTGDEPPFAYGLTRMADADDIGIMGQFLLRNGGRFSRLWWNGARWNPGRAVRHLEEEGRITIVRDPVVSLRVANDVVISVRTELQEIDARGVVLCAGALVTPHILANSGIISKAKITPQNHYSISVAVKLSEPSDAPFDTAVVREVLLDTGELFMVNAYERVSADMSDHGLLTVSHMNPLNGFCDDGAMDKAMQFAYELADSLQHTDGIQEVIVNDVIVPLAHVAATCASLTDDDGRVLGVRGVWVADASVLCQVPTCTPAAPVTMEALRIAQVIAGELS